MDKHIIDQWANNQMAEREIKPSLSVWEQIETELDKQDQPAAKPPKNRIFWVVGITLVCIIGSTWFYLDQKPEVANQATTEKILSKPSPQVQKAQMSVPPVQTIQKNVPPSSQEQKYLQKEHKKMPFVPAPSQNKTKEITPEQPKKSQPEQALYAVQTSEPVLENVIVFAPETKPELPVSETKIQKKGKIDPAQLLAEVEKESSSQVKKYNIDPDILLKEAEKGANERFFNKMVKTLSATSNAVVTAVNNRNTAF
ncbi:MAG: hypothetical protein IPN79_18215 [Saprospiraceae bacterium]|nr:hypothetical protein [Saprospiraceae bacterium]